MSALVDIHTLFQYAALLGVIAAIIQGFTGLLSPMVFDIGIWVLRIQVVLGLIVWIGNSGWNLGAMQGFIHPIAGIAALGAAEAFNARGSRATDGSGDRTRANGFIIALVLVIAAIGVAEMA